MFVKKRTDVVIYVLSTNVEKCTGKVTVSHHESIVQSPQCCGESIGNSGETATRCAIGLEHHEWLPDLLGKLRDVQILLGDAYCSGVG